VCIRIVDNEVCPKCRAGYPNRPKVGDSQGKWWWKCYNKNCNVSYYLPETGEVELEPSKEKYAEIMRQIDKDVE
jgi:hypothetical protein